jgi:MFS family permease
MAPNLRMVIAASSVGTIIEWYDFYLYGSLAVFFSTLFFPAGNPTAALLASLATFGAGFAVRPFGAIVFGRVGDLVGRKYAFLVTLTVMGSATVLVGFIPTYERIGIAAPLILVGLRLLQGLALGGEYGGAATYVAEHAPDEQRGYYTSYIQTTATVGFLLALIVILVCRRTLGEDAFRAWGWRIPFLLSAVLLALSLYIRLRLRESPLFDRLKRQGKSSTAPLRDSFANRRNWRLIVLALFGATAGQAVVWYTGQFYALYFLQTICKIPYETSYLIIAAALIIGTPFFLLFGALSDRIGRKKIIMAGCLIAALSFIPIYRAMQAAAGSEVVTTASQRNPVTGAILLTPQTRVDGALQPAAQALPYADFGSLVSDPGAQKLILLVFIQVLFVTMVYGPIAAYLVEAFPARIRYTALSLPYHIGNGVFGGLLPVIGLSIVAETGNIYAGLYYPIAVAGLTFCIGSLLLKETHSVLIWREVERR